MDDRNWRRALWASSLLTAAMGLWLLADNQRLRTAGAPHGLYELELARTPERARQVLASWQGKQPYFPEQATSLAEAVKPIEAPLLRLAERMQLAGFLFLLAWGATLSLAWWRLDSLTAVAAVAVAALADAAENTLLLRVLQGEVERAGAVFLCAMLKFGLLSLVLAALAVQLHRNNRARLAWAAAISLTLLLLPAVATLLRA